MTKQAGQGTTVRISCSSAAEKPDNNKKLRSFFCRWFKKSKQTGSVNRPRPRPDILIIEEDRGLAFRYGLFIKEVLPGSCIFAYDSVAVALDRLKFIRFDMIFINISSKTEGWRMTAEEIRKINSDAGRPYIPVIGITGSSGRESYYGEYRQSGIDEVLGAVLAENFVRVFKRFGLLE